MRDIPVIDMATLGDVIVTPFVTKMFGPLPVGVPDRMSALLKKVLSLQMFPLPFLVRTGQ